jgi:hypothetical protein
MIYIITPCTRPENLETISKNIPEECSWVIVYDDKISMINTSLNAIFMKCPDTGVVGTKARNYALDHLDIKDEDLILLHDDDNIIHPNWYNSILKYINMDFSIITWGQLYKNNNPRLHPTSYPCVNYIDTASFMIKWKYNKNVRHEYIYYHDGLYAETCAKNGPVICIDEYLSYYNYLR